METARLQYEKALLSKMDNLSDLLTEEIDILYPENEETKASWSPEQHIAAMDHCERMSTTSQQQLKNWELAHPYNRMKTQMQIEHFRYDFISKQGEMKERAQPQCKPIQQPSILEA